MIEHVSFKTESGRKIAAVYYPGNTNAPGVVFCHGFGSSKKSSKEREIGIELNQQGFHVIVFDFNGHGESDGNFKDVLPSKALEDVHAAIIYMKTKTEGKIGVFGSSFGGMIAILETARNLDIKALAVCAAPTDLEQSHAQWSRKELVERYGEFGERFIIMTDPFMSKGTPFMNDAHALQPAEQAKKITCPTLFLHGDEDIIVPLEQSKKYFAQVQGEKQLDIIKGADHFLKDRKVRKPIQQKAVAWFIKWLQ